MRVSGVLNTVVNVAVIVGAGVYFLMHHRATEAPDSSGSSVTPIHISDQDWQTLLAGGSRLGNADETPEVVEFLDYQCPFCAASSAQVGRFLKNHPRGAMAIRNDPLSMHPYAEPAARAAICADEQGRFQSMYTVMLSSSDWHEQPEWSALAKQARVPDLSAFRRCLESHRTAVRLAADRKVAADFGIHATPTFIARHFMYRGSLTPGTLEQLVNPHRP